MSLPPPRLVPLLKQFDDARDRLVARLQGLTDDEYLWEPVPDCWSLRQRGRSRTNHPFGKGAWVMDLEYPEPEIPPLTTIAWRMCHLSNGLFQRANYTTGSRSLAWDEYEIASTAQSAIDLLVKGAQTWRAALTSAQDAELDQVGYSQYPWGLDTRLPFLDIVWWVNQELLGHGAEIALLRDLYRAQPR